MGKTHGCSWQLCCLIRNEPGSSWEIESKELSGYGNMWQRELKVIGLQEKPTYLRTREQGLIFPWKGEKQHHLQDRSGAHLCRGRGSGRMVSRSMHWVKGSKGQRQLVNWDEAVRHSGWKIPVLQQDKFAIWGPDSGREDPILFQVRLVMDLDETAQRRVEVGRKVP